jgi:hypothetical protein
MPLLFSPEGYLMPVAKIEIELSTLEQVFLKGFPNSTTRPKIWANYLRFLDRFRSKVTSNFTQWIDGSFITQKENPNDLDLVTFIDCTLFEVMETLPYAQINQLLEMVQIFNNQIKRALALGKSEASLDVRQAKHLRDRYLRELNALLMEHGINLQDVAT